MLMCDTMVTLAASATFRRLLAIIAASATCCATEAAAVAPYASLLGTAPMLAPHTSIAPSSYSAHGEASNPARPGGHQQQQQQQQPEADVASSTAVWPVCVVGNGPSALAASALLSGHWPFYAHPHPHPPLHYAIQTERARVAGASGKRTRDVSLLELDLTAALRVVGSMEGGRSNNPWALLVDALLHPDADGRHGAADYTCLEFQYLPERSIEHVVIGRGPAGGSWNHMAPGTMTLSPGYWMALPGLAMTEASADLSPRAFAHRIERSVVAEYYQTYARKFLQPTAAGSGPLARGAPVIERGGSRGGGGGGSRGLLIDAEVTAVEAAEEVDGMTTNGNGTCAGEPNKRRRSWRVSYRAARAPGASLAAAEDSLVRSSLQTQVVVLATGMADRPKRLEGCELPEQTDKQRPNAVEILYRAPHSWSWNASAPGNRQRGRVLVVGAGLSAADCIVAALRSEKWDVVHAFRGPAGATKLVSKFGQWPNDMYSEYYELAQLMQHRAQLKPHYEGHSYARLRRVDAEGNCELWLEEEAPAQHGSSQRVAVDAVDRVVVLIGSTPDLSYLQGLGDFSAGAVLPVASPSIAAEVSGRRATHPVYVDVQPHTLQTIRTAGDPEATTAASMYAWGPLRGDNFVRFLVGEAWPLVQRLNNMPQH